MVYQNVVSLYPKPVTMLCYIQDQSLVKINAQKNYSANFLWRDFWWYKNRLKVVLVGITHQHGVVGLVLLR